MKHALKVFATWIIFALMVLPWQSYGQETAQAPLFSSEELEQLVAPIALYPDPLLAQVLMASTYPLEIVSAARWVKANPDLKDKALEDALQQQSWDPSIKSLVEIPEVLNMLNEKLDLTQKLGDAFLAQQQGVLDAVQRLRSKALAQGNLKSSKEQTIAIMPASSETSTQSNVGIDQAASTTPMYNSTQSKSTHIITIESPDPEVVYVPAYDPNVIYGDWSYPSYPPYAYYPSWYAPGTALLSFGVGLAVGAALWGDFNWHDRDININVNRYNQFNHASITHAKWQHNELHRRGVPYRDAATQRKFNKNQQDTQARAAFRGRAEQGRQELSHGGMQTIKQDLAQGKLAQKLPADQKLSAQQRAKINQAKRADPRPTKHAGAFDGINKGGQTNKHSDRGAASRASQLSKQAISRPARSIAHQPGRAVKHSSGRSLSHHAPSRASGISRGRSGGMGGRAHGGGRMHGGGRRR